MELETPAIFPAFPGFFQRWVVRRGFAARMAKLAVSTRSPGYAGSRPDIQMTKVTQMSLDGEGGRAAAASICAKFPATAKRRWKPWARICAPRACAGAKTSPRFRARSRSARNIWKRSRKTISQSSRQDLCDRLCAHLRRLSGPGRDRRRWSATSRKFPAAMTSTRPP